MNLKQKETACYIQLGRLGDVINILPVAKWIRDTTGETPVIVTHRDFASIFDGVSYVKPWVWEHSMENPSLAMNTARKVYPLARVVQVFGAGAAAMRRGSKSFMHDHWLNMGCDKRWESLPLIFDLRDAGREVKLMADVWPTPQDKPVVLVNGTGISGPFNEWPKFRALLDEWLEDRATVIDIGQIRAERFYDLLTLYDHAALLVTIDTATLHLARASRIPVVSMVRAGWAGTQRIRNSLWHGLYEQVFGSADEIQNIILSAISQPRRCAVHGPFDRSSGYGNLTTDTAEALILGGVNVECVPQVRCVPQELPSSVADMIQESSGIKFKLLTRDVHNISDGDWRYFAQDNQVICQYIYETDKIPEQGVRNLNQCHQVISASRWGANVMRDSGVTTPIAVVPLGVDLEHYPVTPLRLDPFVFGAAGQLSGGGTRKNLDMIIRAFELAFPGLENVRLQLKVFPGDRLDSTNDRIDVCHARISQTELTQWLSDITVYVSAHGAEGWGYWLHQAMAMGRPVIGPMWSGETEYLNHQNGYAVEYDLVPATGCYKGNGKQARVKLESLAARMWQAYEHRDELLRKARLAAESARQFNQTRYRRELVNAVYPARARYWHVYCTYPGANEETKQRNAFALGQWGRQYLEGYWIPCPVTDEQLPRLFDDAGRKLPYVKDILNEAVRQAQAEDVVVYCNTDNAPSPTLTYQITQALAEGHPCMYSYRRDVDQFAPLTDEQIKQGQVYAGADLFIMRVDWWRRVERHFPDFVLGGEGWDWCMRLFIDEAGGAKFKYLIYHKKHTPRWRATPELRETLPCQVWDRRLSSEFLHERGLIPNWEPGGVMDLNPT